MFTVAEAGSKKDSIRCRDIRYKNGDQTQPSLVTNKSTTCVNPPAGGTDATEVQLATVTNDSKPSLPTSQLAVNSQPQLWLKTSDHSAKNTGI